MRAVASGMRRTGAGVAVLSRVTRGATDLALLAVALISSDPDDRPPQCTQRKKTPYS